NASAASVSNAAKNQKRTIVEDAKARCKVYFESIWRVHRETGGRPCRRGAAQPRALRLAHAQGLQGEPGPAAGGRGRLLRALVDRAAADPPRDRSFAHARHHASPRLAWALTRVYRA